MPDDNLTTGSAYGSSQDLTLADLEKAYQEALQGKTSATSPWPWTTGPAGYCWYVDHASEPDHVAASLRRPWPTAWEPISLYPPAGVVNGLPVYTSEFLGELRWPTCVIKRGPYFQRRLKRWWRSPPAHVIGTGVFYLSEHAIWCHPDDLPKLLESVNKVHPVDKADS